MAGIVMFQDNSAKVKDALNQDVLAFLEEVGNELQSQAARNQTRVRSGETKGAWDHIIDEGIGESTVTVGNPTENSVWEEFGTGEYAINGDGRLGGWKYEDEDGWHSTHGKKPLRALQKAFNSMKPKIKKAAEEKIGASFK